MGRGEAKTKRGLLNPSRKNGVDSDPMWFARGGHREPWGMDRKKFTTQRWQKPCFGGLRGGWKKPIRGGKMHKNRAHNGGRSTFLVGSAHPEGFSNGKQGETRIRKPVCPQFKRRHYSGVL